MAQAVYLGPSKFFNGKAVTADGLKVTLSDRQKARLIAAGHSFASDGPAPPVITPEEMTAEKRGETVKAVKAEPKAAQPA